MTLETWFQGLSEREQRVLVLLGLFLAVLSVAFSIYYYNHVVVTYTCIDWTGAVVPCPVGGP